MDSPSQSRTYLPFRGVENDVSAYLPLEPRSHEIRYLRLHPGLPDEPIICSLGHTILNTNSMSYISYKALSYRWGEISDTIHIKLYCHKSKEIQARKLDDSYTMCLFRVTRNLEVALRSLRLLSKSIVLWIDAICMKQSDPKEKTYQVGMMSMIYSSAEEVLVWLGMPDWESRIVVRCHELLRTSIRDCTDVFNSRMHPNEAEYVTRLPKEDYTFLLLNLLAAMESDAQLQKLFAQQRSQGMDELMSRFQGDLAKAMQVLESFGDLATLMAANVNHFLANSYFRRIWVYQEVLLAPETDHGHRKVTIRIGRLSLRWGDLVDVVQFFVRSHKGSTPSYRKNIAWFETAWSYMGRFSRASFEKYYSRTQDFISTDPRDKFYALLHLGHNTRSAIRVNPLLSPDYETPLENIILNFYRAGLDLPLHIHMASADSQVVTLPRDGHFQAKFGFCNDSNKSAVEGTNFFLGTVLGRLSLFVRKLDLSARLRGDKRLKQSLPIFMDAFFAELVSICKPHIIGLAQETFLHGISAMIGVQNTVSDVHQTRIITGQTQLDPGYSQRDLDDIVSFRRKWFASTKPYLGVTSNGELVLTGVTLQADDIIAELPGATHPLVLTPVQNQNPSAAGIATQCKITGDCVVYQNEHMPWHHLVPKDPSTHGSVRVMLSPPGEQLVVRNKIRPRRSTFQPRRRTSDFYSE
jgi:hypothetical protein